MASAITMRSAGNLMEINLKNLALIRGGLDNYTEEEGDLVDDAMQKVAGTWAFCKFIKIEHQNHDLGEITITEVKGNEVEYKAVPEPAEKPTTPWSRTHPGTGGSSSRQMGKMSH